jgi:uncharacterized protein (TIGR02569 family)
VIDVPSGNVIAAFGLRGEPTLLAGGEGVAFRVEDVVVKRVIDVQEAGWTQALLHRVEPDGFGIAEPVAADDGGWVHDGWVASRFVDGLRPASPAWTNIIDGGLRFCDAAERVRHGGTEVLRARSHRWAISDRVAWSEQTVDLPADAADLLAEIALLLGAAIVSEHFVHGDLSGNVFFDRAGTPVILDVSPYLRPRRWAAAIVIADAVLWSGADLALASSFANEDADRDLLGRALVYRLVAEQLAENPRHRALLEPYRRVLTALG